MKKGFRALGAGLATIILFVAVALLWVFKFSAMAWLPAVAAIAVGVVAVGGLWLLVDWLIHRPRESLGDLLEEFADDPAPEKPDLRFPPRADDCAECGEHVIATERVFGNFFAAFGFKRLGTPMFFGNDLKAGGKLCVWFYESPDCRFKFEHGDGAHSLLIGPLTAPLNRIYEDDGWHFLHSLAPHRPGKVPGLDWSFPIEVGLKKIYWQLECQYPVVLQALRRESASSGRVEGSN
jgi:hypothetical protein